MEFTGRVEVEDYLGKMDTLILTSISEGQPLTVLEGFAAKKPCIATNVGNCRGLLYGEADDFGPAGILTPVMGVEKIGEAILTLAGDPGLVSRMGAAGYRRVREHYTIQQMRRTYRGLYASLMQPGAGLPEG